MDEERTVEARRLRGAMDRTRASIADTAGELREHVHKAVDWREQVKTHPGACLGVAVTTGLLMGRWAGARLRETASGADLPGGSAEFHSAIAPTARNGGEVTADGGAGNAVLPGLLNKSRNRVGSRVESNVNRLIDAVAERLETAVIPPLLAHIRGLFAYGDPPRPGSPRQ